MSAQKKPTRQNTQMCFVTSAYSLTSLLSKQGALYLVIRDLDFLSATGTTLLNG